VHFRRDVEGGEANILHGGSVGGSELDDGDNTHPRVEILPREEQVEPVVKTLRRGNRLPGTARHEDETCDPAGRNVSLQTHLQSNLRSYGFNERTRLLPHLLFLRNG